MTAKDTIPAIARPVASPVATPADAPAPDHWVSLAHLTPARIALGRTGGSLPTNEVLKFGLAHAQARDAVHLPLDRAAMIEALRLLDPAPIEVASQAETREAYLRRPDLGRRLDGPSRTRLESWRDQHPGPCDLALLVADGLSTTALHANIGALLAALAPRLHQAGHALAPPVLATNARVALGDEVGALLGARAVLVLIGERPGLSSPDSLGAYLTFAPRPGRKDAERNCVSNIRRDGLGYDQAAFKLAWLIGRAFELSLTGVQLKDESEAPSLPPHASPRAIG